MDNKIMVEFNTPTSTTVTVIPYSPLTLEAYYFSVDGSHALISGLSESRDASVYYTIARLLITQSYQYFPMCKS